MVRFRNEPPVQKKTLFLYWLFLSKLFLHNSLVALTRWAWSILRISSRSSNFSFLLRLPAVAALSLFWFRLELAMLTLLLLSKKCALKKFEFKNNRFTYHYCCCHYCCYCSKLEKKPLSNLFFQFWHKNGIKEGRHNFLPNWPIEEISIDL